MATINCAILSLLLLAVCGGEGVLGRRLSDSLNNEMDNNISASGSGNSQDNDYDANKQVDWVRISMSPDAVLRHSEGSHFELECEAVGSPAPKLTWHKGGRDLSGSDEYETNRIEEKESRGLAKVRARLVIHAVLEGNAGVYTCVAKSGRQVAEARTQLFVKRTLPGMHLPQISFIASRTPARIVLYDTIYMDNIGEDVVLPCAAIGTPQPDILWLDPNEVPISDDKHMITQPDGALRINRVRWNDMGPYTCVARNSHGQDNVTTFLYPMLAEK